MLLSERFTLTRPAIPRRRARRRAGADRGRAGAGDPLVGREQEAAAVEDLVVLRGARMVTLTGPGGVGKAARGEAAGRLRPEFRDGVRYVELASVSAAGSYPPPSPPASG